MFQRKTPRPLFTHQAQERRKLGRRECALPDQGDTMNRLPITSRSLPDGSVGAVHELAGVGERYRAFAEG